MMELRFDVVFTVFVRVRVREQCEKEVFTFIVRSTETAEVGVR